MTSFTTIGIIGGGQLGKMLIEAKPQIDELLYKYNKHKIQFNVLDPTPPNTSICKKLCKNYINTSLHNQEGIYKLTQISDIITWEIENINIDALLKFQTIYNKDIIPYPQVLKIIQDKGKQKQFFIKHNIPTAKFLIVKDLDLKLEKPCVIKSCIGGYDGKGVAIIKENIQHGDIDIAQSSEYLIEKFIDCQSELSIIVAVDKFGEMICYPTAEMTFNENNILKYQTCPADISDGLNKQAQEIALSVAKAFASPGLFTVEMFLSKNGKIYVNEVSPRPHNSGHHTIEACQISQFEQLLRILVGLPLKQVQLKSPSMLFNILGPQYYIGPYTIGWNNMPNCNVHIYGKTLTKPGRKLGHCTILGNDFTQMYYLKDIVDIRVIPTLSQMEQHDSLVPYHSNTKLSKTNHNNIPKVGVIMGSETDFPIMKDACEILKQFHVPYETHVVSAHRTPEKMFLYAQTAKEKGINIIIAGAGGAAHLPGMTASLTTLPVIGVPIRTSSLSGIDSLYSIVQMPRGVPVATVAINGAKNAALLAVQILALNDLLLDKQLEMYKASLKELVKKMDDTVANK